MSAVSKSSISITRLNFDRSKKVPLNPVVLEETIGITRTEDALMDSLLNPKDAVQAVFAGKKERIPTVS